MPGAARRRLLTMLHDVHPTTDSPPRVLFVNDLWGYGTVTMAMAVAAALEGRAIRTFAGQGPGFDLAGRDGFDETLRADTMAEPILGELERTVRASDAVVCVLNSEVARCAARHGVPCVYLDCMAWMWAEPRQVPPGVPYYTESFPGTREKLHAWRDQLPDATIVGPLVAARAAGRGEADTVLINFGGLCCRLVDQPTLAAYANVMARCALAALGGSAERVVIAAGHHVLTEMDAAGLCAIAPGVELRDLDHDQYLAELRRSRALISSSGLHALYEACALGVPCVCLPPQNLSGSMALDVLNQAGVHRSLNWSHLYGLDGLDPADEPAACEAIGENVHRFAADGDTQMRLIDHIRTSLRPENLASTGRRQADFLAEQGECGAPEIAARVLALIRSRAAQQASFAPLAAS
jgi:hypothetical protein